MHWSVCVLFLSLLIACVVSDGAFDRYQRKVKQIRQRLTGGQASKGEGAPPKESRKVKKYKCVEEIVEEFDEQPNHQFPPKPTFVVEDGQIEFDTIEQPRGVPKIAAAPTVVAVPKKTNEPTEIDYVPKEINEPKEIDEPEVAAVVDEPTEIHISIPKEKVEPVEIDEKANQFADKEERRSGQIEAPTVRPHKVAPSSPADAPRARAINVQKQKEVAAAVAAASPKLYQLAKVQCDAIKATASTYRVKDVSGWVRKNCGIAKLYLPSATCEELNQYVDSCFH